jgi:hypothetical protein
MKKTPKQWLDEISTTRKRKGKDGWFTASCPICGYSHDVSVLTSDAVGEIAAKERVRSHIRTNHKELVDDTTAA